MYLVLRALFAGKALSLSLRLADHLTIGQSITLYQRLLMPSSKRSSIAVGDEFILKDCPGSAGQFTSPYCKHHYDQSNGFFGEAGNIPEDEKYTESSGSPGWLWPWSMESMAWTVCYKQD